MTDAQPWYDSDTESAASDLELPELNTVFPEPLQCGPYQITCVHDYHRYRQGIHEYLYEAFPNNKAEVAGQINIMDDDWGPDTDEDDHVGCYQDIKNWMMAYHCIVPADLLSAYANQDGENQFDINTLCGPLFGTALTSEWKALAQEFSLEALVETKQDDFISMQEIDYAGYYKVHLNDAEVPPIPPFNEKQRLPIALVLCEHYLQLGADLPRGTAWYSLIGDVLPDTAYFPSQDAPDSRSISSLSTSSDRFRAKPRSYSRPAGRPIYLVFSDGTRINVGVHSYNLGEDQEYRLSFVNADKALAELYSAPAGEGLTNPTPSHELHQQVCAILSAAIASGNVNTCVSIEKDGKDISVDLEDTMTIDFDITTPASLWSKPFRTEDLAVLDKYAIAACLLQLPETRSSRIMTLTIWNCLAVEHPSHFGTKGHDKAKEDLLIQQRILNTLYSMSRTTLNNLSKTSYEAALAECAQEIAMVDISHQGQSLSEKKEILLEAIKESVGKKNVAIPPLPVNEISQLPSGDWDVCVGDQVFHIIDHIIHSTPEGQKLVINNRDKFLMDFPASGIVTAESAQEIATVVNNTRLYVSGQSHRGPDSAEDQDRPDNELWEHVNKIYQSSPFAQYSEILCDLIKAIQQGAAPKVNEWRSRRLYNGKVVAWYSLRDAPNSAEGFRVDWFAISSFKTLGSIQTITSKGDVVHIWPRQRLRSQEMNHRYMLSRRLKIALFSMLEKMSVTRCRPHDIILAWQRLAMVSITSTWESGKNFIACRHMSAGFAAPASPIDQLGKKLSKAGTFACHLLFNQMISAIEKWDDRNKYLNWSPLLGLPRAYSQLESYWQIWVPDELADTNKHFADCLLNLYAEVKDLEETYDERLKDLNRQYKLLKGNSVNRNGIRKSIRTSCTLNTKGKFGWNVFGSLAAGYALSLRYDPSMFDKSYCRGRKAMKTTDHLTVRHSARVNGKNEMVSGTVAECIIEDGLDEYLSTVEPTFKLMYGMGPRYFNHPKNGELKDREISIAESHARICLNKSEAICGNYGKGTGVDMLKVSNKEMQFYRYSADALLVGGGIQSSDASRYSPMMSNIAVAICLLALSSCPSSMHLRYASVVYSKLAFRRMMIDTVVLSEINKRLEQPRDEEELTMLRNFKTWIEHLPSDCDHQGNKVKWFSEAAHTGQGMSHHATSLEHAGGLIISTDAINYCQITIRNVQMEFNNQIMVTSDDSTIIVSGRSREGEYVSRHNKQRACKVYLQAQRAAREIALRMVSVMPNLAKEKISGVAGEFNSQDQGIGYLCPILGFRELICQMVPPSSPSLVGDYLSAYAIAQKAAVEGQGLSTACYAQRMMIDAIEARWRLTPEEKTFLKTLNILPRPITTGANSSEILSGPASHVALNIRERLIALSQDKNSAEEDLDPHVKDTVFGAMLHVKIGMRNQHRKALKTISALENDLENIGLVHQALLLKECKKSTLSSARTRNLGRVAFRIRTREVKPNDYLTFSFERAPMLETTLTWLDHLESTITSYPTSREVHELAITAGKRIEIVRKTRSQFPQPVRRRRFPKPNLRKPSYVLSGYGETPFGQHAIDRGKIEVIQEYGPKQRREVLMYMAGMTYRSYTEHVLYGHSFVVSWAHDIAGSLTAIDLSAPKEDQILERVNWGDFESSAIQILRDVERTFPNIPILALHYISEGIAHFHCIRDNEDYNYKCQFHLDDFPEGTFERVLLQGNIKAIAVNQGLRTDRMWSNTAPTSREIKAFQALPTGNYTNSSVERLMRDVERAPTLEMPLLACKYTAMGVEKVVGMGSRQLLRPWESGKPDSAIPHHRAHCVGECALGGYWYSARKGVAFRAFLRGCSGTRNSWVGSVLGWRMNVGSVPDYHYEPPPGTDVRDIIVIGGINQESNLSSLYPSAFGTQSMYADTQGTHMVKDYHKIEMNADLACLIHTINGGHRFFNHYNNNATWLDTNLPPLTLPDTGLTREEAIARLEQRINVSQVLFF